MKVAIVGSREFADMPLIRRSIDRLLAVHGTDLEIVSGGARGADSIAESICRGADVPFKQFPADWDKFGKSAGFRRNEQIVAYSDMVLAFMAPGREYTRGTRHTVELAVKAGKETHVYFNGAWTTHKATEQLPLAAKPEPKPERETVECDRCGGSGIWSKVYVNGKPEKPAPCYRCKGTGKQTDADQRRNWGYDQFAASKAGA